MALDSTIDRTQPSRPDRHDRRREILETAARLICEKGYLGASLQDIASACGLTKAGLYHHWRSKDELLLAIMHFGMDLFERQVLEPVTAIADPVERLRTCMRLNVRLVTDDRTKEITVILHEHATLTGEAGKAINRRKKRYVRFLESTFDEGIRAARIRPMHPKVAAFSFLGQILWIYKWYRADGALAPAELADEMERVFLPGVLPARPEG